MFSRNSRYYGLDHATYRDDENTVRYVSRRIVPRRRGALAGTTPIGQAERLDLVAERTLGDPLRFWRICDVNNVIDPFSVNAASGRLLDLPES